MAWREIVMSIYYTYWDGYFPEEAIIDDIIKSSNLSSTDSLRDAITKIEKEVNNRDAI